MTEAPQVHVFELVGLGKAPFRFVGFWQMPSKGMQESNPTAYQAALAEHPHPTNGMGIGSCHYCGTPIATHCLIESADGQRFFVGSDCVQKTGDAGLAAGLRKMKRDANRERNEAKRRALTPTLSALVNENADLLVSLPHPNSYFARQGRTWKDYADWMVQHRTFSLSGTQDAIRAVRHIVEKETHA